MPPFNPFLPYLLSLPAVLDLLVQRKPGPGDPLLLFCLTVPWEGGALLDLYLVPLGAPGQMGFAPLRLPTAADLSSFC